MRRGFIGIIALIVIGVSIALTAAYTANQYNKQRTSARAQAADCRSLGGTCGAVDAVCNGTVTTDFCGDPNTVCCMASPRSGDSYYINQQCTVSDGRQGTCQYVTPPDPVNDPFNNCSNKMGANYEHVAGACPGSANVQCCVLQKSSTAATPPPSNPNTPRGNPAGGNPGGGNPPSTSTGRTNHLLGGLIQKSDSGAGLPGVSVTVGTVDSAGNTLPINGQPSFTTTTDAAGNWAAQVALQNGDAYYVRPAGTGPTGYASTPRTSNNTHSKAANLGGNTPISQPSYEQQVVGDGDCASTPGWANGACNFVYDPSGGTSPGGGNPPAGNTPSTSGGSGIPAETACLKPLLRYVNLQTSRHFYTSSWNELGGGNPTYKFEGVMGYVESETSPHCFAPSSQPLYRFVNATTNAHFYLMNNSTPPDASWKLEGMVGYINPAPDPALFTTQLERFVSVQFDDHFYTNNSAEAASLKGGGAYTYEFPAGWTYSDQALVASQPAGQGGGAPGGGAPGGTGGTGGAGGTGPVTNTPPQTAGNPVSSTGTGAPGYLSFTRISFDCTNGMSMSANYTPDPADPTKPNVYFDVVKVTGAGQITPSSGTLLGRGVSPNGGTYNDPHVAWSPGVKLDFYVYTFKENTDPATIWTIHGVDGAGNDVSAANGQPAPLPYSITCPANGTQPPGAGQQGPGSSIPSIVNDGTQTVPEGTTPTNMDITVRIAIANTPGGVSGAAPNITTLPAQVKIKNGFNPTDGTTVTTPFTWKGGGVWEGKIAASLIQGSHFSLSIWPDKSPKKQMCQTGAMSPHAMYPTTYSCNELDGTISLKPGANVLDFTNVKMGAGDVNVKGLHNGHVDSQDLYAIVQQMQKPDRDIGAGADINLDGKVDQADYDLAVWSFQNVPE